MAYAFAISDESDLPGTLRQRLGNDLSLIKVGSIVRCQVSSAGFQCQVATDETRIEHG